MSKIIVNIDKSGAMTMEFEGNVRIADLTRAAEAIPKWRDSLLVNSEPREKIEKVVEKVEG